MALVDAGAVTLKAAVVAGAVTVEVAVDICDVTIEAAVTLGTAIGAGAVTVVTMEACAVDAGTATLGIVVILAEVAPMLARTWAQSMYQRSTRGHCNALPRTQSPYVLCASCGIQALGAVLPQGERHRCQLQQRQQHCCSLPRGQRRQQHC